MRPCASGRVSWSRSSARTARGRRRCCGPRSGLAPRAGGAVSAAGRDPLRLDPAERARRIAYLPQARSLAWPLRVRDVVALGRFAHGAAPGRLGAEDAAAVSRALASCRLASLADRLSDTLSGGELARTHVARAMAAEAPFLLADEPTAALDPLHQHQVMRLVRAYADAGRGVLVVMHDAALAARAADRLVWMARRPARGGWTAGGHAHHGTARRGLRHPRVGATLRGGVAGHGRGGGVRGGPLWGRVRTPLRYSCFLGGRRSTCLLTESSRRR